MTEIKIYSQDETVQLSISGHSGYNSSNDIVCAGISTICYAFAEMVCELSAENKIKLNYVKYDEGLIELDVLDKYGVLMYPLQMLSIGLTALEEKYPANVKISWGEMIF